MGKYLSSYSRHTQQQPRIDPKTISPSTSRRKLHILYLIHDVVHHARFHTSIDTTSSTFSASIQPFLVELVQSAASEQRARVLSRLHSLLDLWGNDKVYAGDVLIKLRQAVTGNLTEQETDKIENRGLPVHKYSGGAVYRMPATHGDPETPYYDLPAGNLLPFLDAGSSAPIRPEQVQALQFHPGPADEPLVNALKDFLKDVESIEHKYNVQDVDMSTSKIDELGQVTLGDEAGDVTGDTYYGWSRAFCAKMKRRRKGQSIDNQERKNPSRESSRSSSRSPVKKRRYSDEYSRDRSLSQTKSPSRFRAASPAIVSVNKERGRWQSAQAPLSPSRTRVASPISATKEPGRWQPAQAPSPSTSGYERGPPPMLQALSSNPTPFQAPPLGPTGIPIPPPRPPNWNGPWPPPPPPAGVPFPPPSLHRSNNFLPPLPIAPPPLPPGYPGSYDYGGSYH